MARIRDIVRIDEERCDGCGQCVPACAEGALQVIDGKARLVSEVYCDGLGACLGECPRGAITIEERDAEEFDLEAAHRHLAERGQNAAPTAGRTSEEPVCPGAAPQAFRRGAAATESGSGSDKPGPESLLGNWPVQLRLVPVRAPYFDGSTLLISADCVPFAFPDFHRRFLAGTTLLVGCPKLDDVELYRRKLAQIFLQNDVREVEVAYMEVPCCYGLVHLVRGALEESGKEIPLTLTKLSIKGEIMETSQETIEKVSEVS